MRQLQGEDSATLVRSTDTFGSFEHEPVPAADMAPAMVALHTAIAERSARILYRGTGIGSYDDAKAKGAFR